MALHNGASGPDPTEIEAALPDAVAALGPRLGALDTDMPLPPLLPGLPARHPGRDEALALLARLDLASGDTPFTAAHVVTALRVTDLPCCPALDLVEIAVASGHPLDPGAPAIASLLIGPGGIVGLDGTSGPLHAVAAQGGVTLEGYDAVAAYMRLFCGTVRGDGGPFTIVEQPGDIPLSDAPDAPHPETLAAALRPLAVEQDDEAWTATGTVCYAAHLFHSSFRITPAGQIEMAEDDPVTEDLPMAPLTWNGFWRQ